MYVIECINTEKIAARVISYVFVYKIIRSHTPGREHTGKIAAKFANVNEPKGRISYVRGRRESKEVGKREERHDKGTRIKMWKRDKATR